MKPKLVFVHGWGFHGGVWGKIAPHFEDAYDISYWGPAYLRGGPPLTHNIPAGAVCIAYSFGVAQAVAATPKSLGGLVSICGFDSLPARGRDSAVRDLMAGLSRNGDAQMRAFWAACNIRRFTETQTCDFEALAHGLRGMLQLDARGELRALSCPVLALASRDDKVIPFDVSETVWTGHQFEVADTGGHGLPLTRPEWCTEQIKMFLEEHVA